MHSERPSADALPSQKTSGSVVSYESVQFRESLHWKWKLNLVLVFLLFLGFFVLPFVTVRHESLWLDEVTGSSKRQSTWPFGLKSTPVITPSPLQTRLQSIGALPPPKWKHLTTGGRSIFGTGTYAACSSAPEILKFAGTQQDYLDVATDAEVLALIAVLQTGTANAKEAAIDGAFDKAYRTPLRDAK